MLPVPRVRNTLGPICQVIRFVRHAYSNIPSARTFTMMHNAGFSGVLPNHAQRLMLQQQRYGSEDCQKDKKAQESRCGSPRLKKNPCRKPQKKEKKKVKKEKVKTKDVNTTSMWYIKDCPVKDGCDLPIRLDVLHYRTSDKNREYQKTWTDCPRIIYKPRKVCLNPAKNRAPKIKRRKMPYKSKSAVVCKTISPMECGKKQKDIALKCPRFVLPCCKPARNPPLCNKARSLDPCVRPKTPYPSYSECKKDEIEAPPPNECHCLDPVALCETWAEMRRRLVSGKPIPPKCGQY